ncbi:MAG: hypothetical protein ABSA33_04795 [Candidatus Micrarchaeaceae archaeon]
MTVREEFIKAAIECLPSDGEYYAAHEKYATLWADQCIENNSIEFIMFKMGFIKGEEHGSKK